MSDSVVMIFKKGLHVEVTKFWMYWVKHIMTLISRASLYLLQCGH